MSKFSIGIYTIMNIKDWKKTMKIYIENGFSFQNIVIQNKFNLRIIL